MTRLAGTVVVEGSEAPLIGANIVVVDANLGAATDAQGFFLIGNVSPGTYEVEFIGSDYTSGVYFYKLTTNNFSEVKKMLLIK